MSALTLAGIVRRHAAERPGHPYLHFEGVSYTYARLGERTDGVASALSAAGVSSGDRVALIDRNGPACLEVMFGAAKCGAIYVPVSWRLAPSEIAAILDDADPAIVIVGAHFLPTVAPVLERRPTIGIVVLGGKPCGDDGDLPGPEYEEWLSANQPADPGIVSDAQDVALLMYTSGTTGVPKGVMLTNGSLLGRMPNSGALWGYDTASVNLVVMPLFHIGGISIALESIVPGAVTVLMREFEPGRVLDAIGEHRVTNMLLVPAMIQFLLEHPACGAIDWSSLRTLIYGGAAISDALLQRAMEVMRCDFVQIYGMTEHSGCVSCLPASDHDPSGDPELLRSCGTALPWVDLGIRDPETGAPRPVGEVGEIWVRSDQTMLGYWGRPEATAEVITAESWLRTGDAGFLDEQDHLFICDRIKDMIISGGENVYPSEVENVLLRHDRIADAAVIGVPDERWGEAPKAVIVAKPGAVVTAEEVIAFCRNHLAGFKCPRSVDLVDALPRNASGKVLKPQLREPFWRAQARGVN